jgi:hypothetical protein
MALASEITDLTRRINGTFMRNGAVYVVHVSEFAVFTAHALGRMKELSLNFEPINSAPDSQGQANTMGFNMTASFTLMQTAPADLAAAFALAAPADDEDGVGGFNLLFTNTVMSEIDAATVYELGDVGGSDTERAKGIALVNALVQVGPQLNFSGEESGVPCTVTARIPAHRARDFMVTTNHLTLAL